MSKHLQSAQHKKVTPAHITAAIGDSQKRMEQARDYVRDNDSLPIFDPVKVSNLEIDMEVVKGLPTNMLNLHLFGTQGEYLLMPYSLATGFKKFTFMDSPLHDERDFLVGRFGFSCEFDEILLSFFAKELSDEEKPHFI